MDLSLGGCRPRFLCSAAARATLPAATIAVAFAAAVNPDFFVQRPLSISNSGGFRPAGRIFSATYSDDARIVSSSATGFERRDNTVGHILKNLSGLGAQPANATICVPPSPLPSDVWWPR
jgi:hypothetical protein